jgi:hypothetical protein
MKKILLLSILYSLSFASFKEISYREATKNTDKAIWMLDRHKCVTSVEHVKEALGNEDIKTKEAIKIIFEDYYAAGKLYDSQTSFFIDKNKNKIKVISDSGVHLFFKNKKDCKKLEKPLKNSIFL